MTKTDHARDPEGYLLSLALAMQGDLYRLREIEADTPSCTPACGHLGDALSHAESAMSSIRAARAALIEARGGIDRAHQLAAE